ncbi:MULTISPECIES: nitric oxide reductase transcriptional regulator NorR [unclassified Shewanella]|uniref:nitric oxide reductase transcriptional regulator NorR n=1 Tax=unclassified Shewanella TaxID=196818 RepID=UPI001BC4BE17|nr:MULTISPECIES: nitric oxide reductase transcriptional regulator NorR [unclassified Shewanella]GIU05913.1 anaerobic nitric oxide reductase transcription regulator NorR [Shewanella sp. MBTL60-112-B1]GIU25683.1 anaerobic nitric oxide reductase transcription regulator NorR [Shewanella sp. MBTL60-112-B2]
MSLSQSDLTRIALDITSGLSDHDRFSRLLDTVRQTLHCDAAALLQFSGKQFTPLAINGLSPDVLGRRFILSEHPRLEAIARAGDVVRFPADSELPDPYDGLIPHQEDHLVVHACIGLPLVADGALIGAVTIDGFDPDQFNDFSDKELRTLSAIASASLNNALLIEKLEKQAVQSQETSTFNHSSDSEVEIIGQSPAMQAMQNELKVVASTDLNVLILGDTGTGKELVAKSIHQRSPRANKPLVYLNCAALPESVAESELFGHVKGAFTGAISHRSGKFEIADNGTLFLDEIGELPLSLQSKLLRVLQYGDLQKVGSDKSLKVDVRIIAATNKDLKQEVLAGRFRADLYHRLSVFPIIVPPLNERQGDVILLSGFFVERSREKLGLKSLSLSPDSINLLNTYNWPGNVRELEHVLRRAAVLSRAQYQSDTPVITPQHFDLHRQDSLQLESTSNIATKIGHSQVVNHSQNQSKSHINSQTLKQATENFQAQYIRQALAANGNNWAATARALDLDSGNLHRLAKRIGLK